MIRNRTLLAAASGVAASLGVIVVAWSQQTQPTTIAATMAAFAPASRPSPSSTSRPTLTSRPVYQPGTRPSTNGSNDSGNGRWGNNGNNNRRNFGGSESAPAGGATTGPAGAPAVAENFDERYGVVSERNIFLRDRVRRPPPGMNGTRNGSDRPSAPPPTLESQLVLRGIVLEDDVYRAYFENTGTSQMVRVGANEPIAHGRIVELSVDSVLFESERGQTPVFVGSNLEGTNIAPPPTMSGGGSTSQPSGTGGGSLSAVEERLRQQRLQRTGGGGGTPASGGPNGGPQGPGGSGGGGGGPPGGGPGGGGR